MFVCCNGKIILFTEINNSKKGLSHFLDSPITEAAQTANKLDAAIVGQGYIGKT